MFVFDDAGGKWMPTRRIWNQQSYHVTNIKADATLPKTEVASSSAGGFNNYRAAVQGKGEGLAPDLTVSLATSRHLCPASYVLRATVRNVGSAGVGAGIPVRFFAGAPGTGPLLGEAKTAKPLFPGSAESVELTVPAASGSGFGVDVDGGEGGAVAECNEKNNVASIGAVSCEDQVSGEGTDSRHAELQTSGRAAGERGDRVTARPRRARPSRRLRGCERRGS
ncbi:MAG: hypothetical protein HYV09_08260 [Deltaproteobacteria bacterium]|nr:hypothetical protein [Deltaproteobacteria bacterium]